MERVGYEQLKQYAEWQEWDEPRGIQNDATMMARELLAYRQSGALEALKAAEPALWILAASGNKDAAEKHRTTLTAIAKLEAIWPC
jgi:hypothetical protein